MVIPTTLPALNTYYDPQLWLRLAPKVAEEQRAKVQHLIDGRWKTLEEARELIGFLRGLDWVLATADELTRVADAEG